MLKTFSCSAVRAVSIKKNVHECLSKIPVLYAFVLRKIFLMCYKSDLHAIKAKQNKQSKVKIISIFLQVKRSMCLYFLFEKCCVNCFQYKVYTILNARRE